jgi:stage III sporulation protein AB
MKLFLIIFIVIISLALAVNCIQQSKNHIKCIKQIVLMIENIEILLSFNKMTIQNIFKHLSENETYSMLKFIKPIYNNMVSGTDKYILGNVNLLCLNNTYYLKKDDKDNLKNFFNILGKSDLKGQISNCVLHKEIFKKSLDEIEKTEMLQCKSVGILIIGIGFLISILLL